MMVYWAIPVIASILLLSVGLAQQANAQVVTDSVVVVPDRQAGPVGDTLKFQVTYFDSGRGAANAFLTVTCDTTDPPTFTGFSKFNPSVQVSVNSDSSGIFKCSARVTGDESSPRGGLRSFTTPTFLFIPVFNSIAPDTTITEVKDFTKDILLQSGDSVLTQGNTARVQFSFTGTDDFGVERIGCNVSGPSTIILPVCVSPRLLTLPLGENTIRIQAFDGFNLDPTPAEFKVTVLKDTDGDGIADNADPTPGTASNTFCILGICPGNSVIGIPSSFSGYSSTFNPKIPEYCLNLSDAVKEKFTTCGTSPSFKWQSSSKPSTPKPSFSMPSFNVPKMNCSGFGCSWSTGSGSSIVQVDNGIGEVEFEATDGRLATATIEAGNTIIFDPDAFTFAGALDNTSPVEVLADGQPLVVFVGPDLTQLTQLVADLEAALAQRDAALADLNNLYTNNSCFPIATSIQEVLDCILQLNADLATAQADLDAANVRIAELEALLGQDPPEEDTFTEKECQKFQKTADKAIKKGKQVPPGIAKNLVICAELFP